jgi:hypothetical protein
LKKKEKEKEKENEIKDYLMYIYSAYVDDLAGVIVYNTYIDPRAHIILGTDWFSRISRNSFI